MNDILFNTIKLASEAAQEAYKAGHDSGYRLGFKDGVAAAQKIIREHFEEVQRDSRSVMTRSTESATAKTLERARLLSIDPPCLCRARQSPPEAPDEVRAQEEGFRGGEAAAFEAEQQATIQRTLK